MDLSIVLTTLLTAGARAFDNAMHDSTTYFLTKGPAGQLPETFEFHPLSMHMNKDKRLAGQSVDQRYFVRIFASTAYDEHCQIQKSSEPPIEYWTISPLLTPHQLKNADFFQFNLDKNASKPFIIPANTKWECVIDPNAKKMELYKLESDAVFNAVLTEENEPIFDFKESSTTPSPTYMPSPKNNHSSVTSIYQRLLPRTKESLVIATGSCLQQRFKRLKAFGAMSHYKPDIIVLSGDNIYLDMIPYQYGCAFCLNNEVVDNEQCIGNCFNWFWQNVQLDASTEYKRLLRHRDFPHSTEEWNPIWLAVWDDHDYGKDNSNANYPHKLTNKRAFVEFYKTLNRGQPWIRSRGNADMREMEEIDARGIYHHYHHVQSIRGGQVNVDFVMLDVRYHRTNEDMLGANQWRWLRELMQNVSKSRPHWLIFVLGTTFLLEHPSLAQRAGAESWDTESRLRLETMMERSAMPRNRILLISGDVHYSVVHDFNGLKEFTVSSFTHSLGSIQKCCGTKESEFAVTPVQCVDGYGILELTQNAWDFKLKDANRGTYIPWKFRAQSME